MREAGNHQSSMSRVPWEGILGNKNDKLACDGNVLYHVLHCFQEHCFLHRIAPESVVVNSLTQQ